MVLFVMETPRSRQWLFLQSQHISSAFRILSLDKLMQIEGGKAALEERDLYFHTSWVLSLLEATIPAES